MSSVEHCRASQLYFKTTNGEKTMTIDREGMFYYHFDAGKSVYTFEL